MAVTLEKERNGTSVGIGVGWWDDGENVVAFGDETFDGIEICDFCFFCAGSCCSTVAIVSFSKLL